MSKLESEPRVNCKKVYVAKTKSTGWGIFAKKDIKKGECIFTAKGRIKKCIIKDEDSSKQWKCTACIGLNRISWIDPYKNNPLRFMNHSCNPNAGIKGRVRFYAMHNIKKGEEVTFDYSITEEDVFWKMKCACGHRECRKEVCSIQFLPENVFVKYLPFIPTHFKRLYLKKRNGFGKL
ncbi:MAG: SET domain-containing protein [Patescibacteria group bacterium]|nr:SET domain-containing protein [Patescibacteria group bacterium]